MKVEVEMVTMHVYDIKKNEIVAVVTGSDAGDCEDYIPEEYEDVELYGRFEGENKLNTPRADYVEEIFTSNLATIIANQIEKEHPDYVYLQDDKRRHLAQLSSIDEYIKGVEGIEKQVWERINEDSANDRHDSFYIDRADEFLAGRANEISGFETVARTAIRWGVTTRNVRKHCATGRVRGARKVGRDWLIPESAEKPEDTRKQEFTLYTWVKYIYSTEDVASIYKRLSQSSYTEIKCEVRDIYDQFLEPESQQAHSIDKTATYLWKRAQFWANNYPDACEKWFEEN